MRIEMALKPFYLRRMQAKFFMLSLDFRTVEEQELDFVHLGASGTRRTTAQIRDPQPPQQGE